LITSCQAVAPGQQNLNYWQKTGLELVSLFKGRDVVLAIDLTESVGLNDEGRIRLRQIIEDSLQKGDSVYVVPFASKVNPLAPKVNPITSETAIPFTGKTEDIDRILNTVPLQANITQQRTDIQLAESLIYRELAQVNQCRLVQNRSIKPQSVVWLTDAPLFAQPGITSKQWVETPADSPFRVQNSPQSQERKNWLEALPLQERSRSIDHYQLTVVDIAPTVQEFCTPAPGGKETCLVTPYLIQQLWLPGLILFSSLIGVSVAGGLGIKYLMSLKKNWQLKIIFEDSQEEQIRFLRNQQSLAIGDDIECPGSEIRGYLKRDKNQLYLEPVSQELPIYYQGREITKRQPLSGNYIRLNCPYNSRDFELNIQVKQ
jgi:hypothetical protein